ncbi:hypothetical protein KY289_008617 [Solanum tuberosum]|nr:hypothetical protein KY289_008617 [Solanum tuberosum]
MARVVDPKPGPHQLTFWNLLTIVLKAFEVPLGEGKHQNKKDMITRATGSAAILLNDLRAARDQNATLPTETESLITNLVESQGELARLKDQLLQQQHDNNARVDSVL